jgi:hypothetical protein
MFNTKDTPPSPEGFGGQERSLRENQRLSCLPFVPLVTFVVNFHAFGFRRMEAAFRALQ